MLPWWTLSTPLGQRFKTVELKDNDESNTLSLTLGDGHQWPKPQRNSHLYSFVWNEIYSKKYTDTSPGTIGHGESVDALTFWKPYNNTLYSLAKVHGGVLKMKKVSSSFLKTHSPHTSYFISIEIMELCFFLKKKQKCILKLQHMEIFFLKINDKIIWFLLFIINGILYDIQFWSSLNVTNVIS